MNREAIEMTAVYIFIKQRNLMVKIRNTSMVAYIEFWQLQATGKTSWEICKAIIWAVNPNNNNASTYMNIIIYSLKHCFWYLDIILIVNIIISKICDKFEIQIQIIETKSYSKMNKTKLVDLDKLYNFVVEIFSFKIIYYLKTYLNWEKGGKMDFSAREEQKGWTVAQRGRRGRESRPEEEEREAVGWGGRK